MKPQADLILTPGKRMQALCEARGISRKELANRLDIAPSQVSRGGYESDYPDLQAP